MPIIGDGNIASVLTDRSDRIYFASGVSDSSETRESEFAREIKLLWKQSRTKRLVYFSSLCVFYSDTPYAQHKRRMEELTRKFPKYTIIRLGNIKWDTNPHTVFNYLKAHPEAKRQNVYRYLVSKKEFLHWIDLIPNWNCEINITGKMINVKDI